MITRCAYFDQPNSAVLPLIIIRYIHKLLFPQFGLTKSKYSPQSFVNCAKWKLHYRTEICWLNRSASHASREGKVNCSIDFGLYDFWCHFYRVYNNSLYPAVARIALGVVLGNPVSKNWHQNAVDRISWILQGTVNTRPRLRETI